MFKLVQKMILHMSRRGLEDGHVVELTSLRQQKLGAHRTLRQRQGGRGKLGKLALLLQASRSLATLRSLPEADVRSVVNAGGRGSGGFRPRGVPVR